MTPAIAEGLGEATAATDPRAIALAVEQRQKRDEEESEDRAPHDPHLVRVVKKDKPGLRC